MTSSPAAVPRPIDPDGDPDLVPGWLRRLAAIGWRVLAALALGLVLVRLTLILGTVTASIVVALIVASTFAPYVHRLRERGWDRTKAALAVTGVALLVIVVTGILLFLAFAPHVGAVVASIKQGIGSLDTWLTDLGTPSVVIELVDRAVATIETWVAGVAAQIVGPIANLVTVLILGGFLTFFLLQDGDKAWTALTSSLDEWRVEALSRRGRIALERVGGYLRGTALMASTDAISDFIYLTILGVPLAAPLAVLVFLGGFIPYIGGFITTSILLLVTATFAGPTAALILIILIVITNLFQGNLLAPLVYGRTVEIHPALVLMALPAGAALFGVMGLFAALPMVAFVLAITPAVVESLDSEPGTQTANGLVPTWLDRLGQWSWRGLVVIALLGIIIGVAVTIPTVIVPIVLAIVLAATLEPVAGRLRARGMGRGRSALVATGLSAVIVIGVIVLTIVSMLGSVDEVVDTSIAGAIKANQDVHLVDVVRAFGTGLLTGVSEAVAAIASLGVVLLLATLLTFYFLRDGTVWWSNGIARIHGVRGDRIALAGPKAIDILNGYMVGTGVISVFGAVTQWLIMVILGLPLALPIAVLAFFGGFIPYIGSAITTLLGFLVAVAVGSTTDIVIMLIYTVVFNIVQGNFVAPLVYGRAVSLHPAVVLLAIPAGGAVAGILGMFLVVPFLGVVAATWRTVLHAFDPDDELEPVEVAADPGPAVPTMEPAPSG
jgi:predicted PurR-regulated permease PerM